jgi:dihydroorotase
VLRAASGMPLVQFSVIMMLEMARQGIFSKEMVVEKMSHAPAKLYHIEKRGYLRAGYYADIAVIDTEAPHEITDGEVLSKCGWTPFAGTYVHSKVIKTFVNGALVYDGGKIDDQVRGKRAVFTI